MCLSVRILYNFIQVKIEPLQISSVSETSKDSKQPKGKGKAKDKQPESAPVEPAPAVQEAEAPSSRTLEGACV